MASRFADISAKSNVLYALPKIFLGLYSKIRNTPTGDEPANAEDRFQMPTLDSKGLVKTVQIDQVS